jgi:hypothetical protein
MNPIQRRRIFALFLCGQAWVATTQVNAAISSATHTGTGASSVPIIHNDGSYGVGISGISDRNHLLRRGTYTTFSSAPNGLSGVGSWSGWPEPSNDYMALPFPGYLEGNDYVTVNQANRSPQDYVLTITTDVPSYVYLLLDTRMGDPSTDGSGNPIPSNKFDDPGLTFAWQAWVAANGWTRVNTGLTPNGAGDYVGIDENGDNTLDTYYAVYRNVTGPGNVIQTFAQGESRNMYSVSVRPIPEPASLVLMMAASAVGCWRRRRIK